MRHALSFSAATGQARATSSLGQQIRATKNRWRARTAPGPQHLKNTDTDTKTAAMGATIRRWHWILVEYRSHYPVRAEPTQSKTLPCPHPIQSRRSTPVGIRMEQIRHRNRNLRTRPQQRTNPTTGVANLARLQQLLEWASNLQEQLS